MEAPLSCYLDFKMALYQFLMPTVELGPGGIRTRMEDISLLNHVDVDILSALEDNAETAAPRVTSSARGRRCKNVGRVERPSRPSALPQSPAIVQTEQPRRAVPSRPSSTVKKRTRKTYEDDGLQEKEGEEGEEGDKKKAKQTRTSKRKTKDFRQLKKYRKYLSLSYQFTLTTLYLL